MYGADAAVHQLKIENQGLRNERADFREMIVPSKQPPNVDMFDRLDANNDGVLDRAEFMGGFKGTDTTCQFGIQTQVLPSHQLLPSQCVSHLLRFVSDTALSLISSVCL